MDCNKYVAGRPQSQCLRADYYVSQIPSIEYYLYFYLDENGLPRICFVNELNKNKM